MKRILCILLVFMLMGCTQLQESLSATPMVYLGETPKPTPALPAQTVQPEPVKSEPELNKFPEFPNFTREHYKIYREINKELFRDIEKPEDEVFTEMANKYSMEFDELKRLFTVIALTTIDAKNIETDFKDYGRLISVYFSGGLCVLKYKIEALPTSNQTIQQNFHTIEHFILDSVGGQCLEIQYYAVANMANGEESKVISFTLNEDIIEDVINGKLFAADLKNCVSDLWILPSLLD